MTVSDYATHLETLLRHELAAEDRATVERELAAARASKEATAGLVLVSIPRAPR